MHIQFVEPGINPIITQNDLVKKVRRKVRRKCHENDFEHSTAIGNKNIPPKPLGVLLKTFGNRKLFR